MANIMFFNIPAHGHTNPTVEVVRELTRRGHRVRYYSFPEFQAKLKEAGAEFVSCEGAMPPAPDDLDKRVGRDFALLMEMVIGVTENLHGQMEVEFAAFRPDCIVSDSVCIWGKLFAKCFGIPLVCSTTTLAFNRHTAGLMKQSIRDILRMFMGMPKVMKGLGRLEALGYEAKSVIELLQNDNETNTVVYTSKHFQPRSETFSERYAFVGPSVSRIEGAEARGERPLVYISLGTVLNRNVPFYKNCIRALKDAGYDVMMSVGPDTNIEGLGQVPDGFEVYPRVDQMAVLSHADVFITHCGMNSVMESLSMGVPMVMFPQHAEERAVGNRAAELGAGLLMKRGSVKEIRECVQAVLEQRGYKEAALAMAEDFRRCTGAVGAADWIERAIYEGE